MFAAIAGPAGAASQPWLAAAAAAMQGMPAPLRLWRDDTGAAGMAGASNGILPEDMFDRQPWRFAEWTVVSAGRLDNRAELIARLGIGRSEGREMADSEIVARTCARWGEEAPLHLYGDWAFAAWNAADRTLVAAVNHLGTVPLYFRLAGGTLCLATQLAALMAHPPVPIELNRRALAVHLAPRRQLGMTMFQGLHHIEGGTLMIWRDGALNMRRWWNPDTAARQAFRNERDYVEQAMALFDDAVEQRMRAAGGIAAAMSGGLDSSLVAATAARRLAASGRGLDVYTSVPEPGLAVEERTMWDADDWPFAAAVARLHPNMTHHAVTPGGTIPPDLAPESHRRMRNPLGNTANHVWFRHIIDRARAQGACVILGGEHGNVSLTVGGGFGREDWHNPSRYRFQLNQFWFRATRGALLERVAGALRHPKVVGPLQSDPATRRDGADFLSAAWRDELQVELRRSASIAPRADFVRAAIRPFSGAGGDLPASWGCEWRDPMNDRRLIETLLTYPYAAFRAGGRDRGLARQVAKGRLPDIVRLRYTRGAQAPDAPAWFAPHAARYRDVFETMRNSPLCNDIMDLAHLEHTLDALCKGDRTRDHHSTHRALDAGQFIVSYEARAW